VVRLASILAAASNCFGGTEVMWRIWHLRTRKASAHARHWHGNECAAAALPSAACATALGKACNRDFGD
jgi:hypothetical protein